MENAKDPSPELQLIDASQPYPMGINPERDAWYTAFFIENHLDHPAYPHQVASPEKVRFMVYCENEERYYPCSDIMFEAIINRIKSFFLQEKYNDALQRVLALVDTRIEDETEKSFLKALLIIKYKHETRDELMIPSRLEKRMIKIFLNRTQIEDPCLFEKAQRNRWVDRALDSPAFKAAFNHVEDDVAASGSGTIDSIRQLINRLQLTRLLFLSVNTDLWQSPGAADFTTDDYLKIFNNPQKGNGLKEFFDFLGISPDAAAAGPLIPRKILWLADESGEILVDLAIIRFLVSLGHNIVIALKEGPLYHKVACPDCRQDGVLRRHLKDALWINDKNLGKNELADILRSDKTMFIISDGTRENINLLLTTTTMARIFKEADGVVSRGRDQKRRLFDTHFNFTQDVFNIAADEDDALVVDYKPRHPEVIKFSHRDLENKAQAIVDQMRNALDNEMTVMFYSGIIGSIPGKIKVAKKVMATSVAHLKNQSAMTFIINPSEHFEPGMDADDLMYMWEIVQRSGLINIWRFQTYEDIVQAFEIMGRRVPPEWVGKDATFSTGCTKEMNIAIDVQKAHPEMQIIGPDKEKFVRRAEYGLGKMYDQRLIEI